MRMKGLQSNEEMKRGIEETEKRKEKSVEGCFIIFV
jgi:hypothetical protein